MQAGGREFESLYLHWSSKEKTKHCTLKTAYIKHLKYVKRRDRDETRRCESNEVEKQQTNKPSDINAIISERPSKKERRADALALRADERRDKLR